MTLCSALTNQRMALLFLSAAFLMAHEAVAAECTISGLRVRSGDMPIDVKITRQDPSALEATAMMDYAMTHYTIEADAPAGCKISGLPGGPQQLDAGATAGPTVIKTGTSATATITVTRRDGKETALAALSVDGASLDPPYEADVPSYSVSVPLTSDTVSVVYVPLDNGQRVALRGGQESIGRRRELRREDSRALLDVPIGESQHLPSALDELIDVGGTREFEVIVKSADGNHGVSYKIKATRPSCPATAMYFDPIKIQCASVCNEGYYANANTKRCTTCSEDNCAVCPNNACEECAEGYQLVRRSDSNQCQGQAFASGILTGGALTVFDWLFLVGGSVTLLVLVGMLGLRWWTKRRGDQQRELEKQWERKTNPYSVPGFRGPPMSTIEVSPLVR
ncbi:unnamed protein product [Vitrella brassicaformis CCMP3155]|uniref:Cadherin-like beta-sandwich-like domain-containing protein n=2 Tax=Vitrella brassicaformis TaxID=1169539 RepID=A0A0G4EB85_VITBC|nr:unnamed protein product [Vitrella brassicaformis CCMP3155]|eukprot:CEL93220.1 unnamed protein product [Vitrella brassicaformis CCMP3155]